MSLEDDQINSDGGIDGCIFNSPSLIFRSPISSNGSNSKNEKEINITYLQLFTHTHEQSQLIKNVVKNPFD